MTTPIEALEARLRDAMEGVTPGPWKMQLIPSRASAARYNVVGPSEIVLPHDGICEPDRLNDRSFAEDEANMRFIALCSPDNIAALLDALASQDATIRQMREALEKNASLLEVIAEDAKNRGDTATWSMASVMAEEVRAALNGGAK